MKIKYFNSFNNEINDLILKNYPEFLKEKEPDVLISYGGDGTVLDCFRYLIKESLKIPILVFQGGTFNFLSTKHNENILNILNKIKNNDIQLYEEKFIPIVITFNKSNVWYYALNDIIIGENILSYPEFIINSNDCSLSDLNYKGMGLCISSALGSTGFNLNNNGQIFINKNNLSITSIVGNKDINDVLHKPKINIKLLSNRDKVYLYLDGQNQKIPFKINDEITIKLSSLNYSLMYLNENELFNRKQEIIKTNRNKI